MLCYRFKGKLSIYVQVCAISKYASYQVASYGAYNDVYFIDIEEVISIVLAIVVYSCADKTSKMFCVNFRISLSIFFYL